MRSICPRLACCGAFFVLFVLSRGCLAGQVLDFDGVLEAADRHAHDVRMAALDVGISRSQLKEAKSAYFPALSARFNSQYSKDLANTPTSQVTAVGDTIFAGNTLYQNSIALNVSLNLYDFGAREKRVLMASRDIPLKEAVYVQLRRDTRLKALETYRDLLLVTTDLTSKQQLLRLYREIAAAKERLSAAGLVSRIEAGDEAIRVVRVMDEMDTLKLRLTSLLEDLSLLTGERYEAEGLLVAHFKDEETPGAAPFDPAASPESRIYDLALEKKRAEIEMLEKGLFYPQFSLYAGYILYGQDLNRYGGAYDDMRARTFSVGVAATIPFFDGFKNSAQVEKARIELERLKVEREKKLSELTNRYGKARELTRTREKSLSNQQEIMTKTEQGTTMTAGLAERRIIEHVEYLRRQIGLAVQTQEVTRARIEKAAAARELRMLAEVVY